MLVAELSANHNGSLQIAIDTIRAAKRAGADAVKLQTYRADTITLDCDKEDFQIKQGTLWDGQTLYHLYEQAYTPWEWHEELFRVAKEEGLVCFSSPFDLSAVDFLEELECPIYKIASFEITDIPLIRYAARCGKPMVISTGIATEEDISLAVATCREEGNEDVTLLKCTSSYPAPAENMHLRMIPDLAHRFGVKSGLSDHSMGLVAPVLAVGCGAVMVEKHFILDRKLGGPDSAFSMEAEEFAAMVRAVREAEAMLGEVNYSLSEQAKVNREFCRSLYVAEDIAKGERITEQNVRSVRPGFGLAPRYLPDVLGRCANRALHKGERFRLEDVE